MKTKEDIENIINSLYTKRIKNPYNSKDFHFNSVLHEAIILFKWILENED